MSLNLSKQRKNKDLYKNKLECDYSFYREEINKSLAQIED